MAIQIIDGFQVNAANPIDNRIVASGSNARNAIPYKYNGLRVFDTYDSIPYVWLNDVWISENSFSVSGSGTSNTIPLLTSSNVIGNSVIKQSGGNIGIDKTPSTKLDVNGTISGTFSGNGTLISNINANNITQGNLSLARISNGSNGFLLTAGNSQPQFTDPLLVSVGTSSVAISSNKLNLSTGNDNLNYLIFASQSIIGANPRTSNNLSYDASNNNLNIVALKYSNSSTSYSGTFSDGAYSANRSSSATYISTQASVSIVMDSINVSNNRIVTIECTFVNRSSIGMTSYYQSNKYIGTFRVGGTGVISQITSGTIPSPYSVHTTGSTIPDGFVDISTNNVIRIIQQFVSLDSYSSSVYYSIVVL